MSRTTSSALRRVSMFACILLSAAMAHAQYRTSIQGAVTDTSGAVIAGANLTLTSTSRKTPQKAKRVMPTPRDNSTLLHRFEAVGLERLRAP